MNFKWLKSRIKLDLANFIINEPSANNTNTINKSKHTFFPIFIGAINI